LFEIRQTQSFSIWLRELRDRQARARILVRIDRLMLGNPGDVRMVGDGVSELRIDYGPGYRVYYVRRGTTLIVLLAGGDKRTQNRDIETAHRLAGSL
jgi:putative addiction module killer protein